MNTNNADSTTDCQLSSPIVASMCVPSRALCALVAGVAALASSFRACCGGDGDGACKQHARLPRGCRCLDRHLRHPLDDDKYPSCA